MLGGIGAALRVSAAPAATVAGSALLLGATGLLAGALGAWSRAGVADGAAVGWRANWPQLVVVAVLPGVALVGAVAAGHGPIMAGPNDLVVGGALTLGAFPLLVLERHLAGTAPAALPHADDIAGLVRVAVLALVGLGLVCFLGAGGVVVSPVLVQAVGWGVAAVGAELVLRAGAAAFLPPAPAEAPRYVPRSLLAGLLRTSRLTPGGIGRGLRERFGIDLSRSWALGFLRRSAVPALGGLMVAGWLLTGVTALRLDQRGVYARFGAPVAVLGPGLHWHLPWPLGAVRPIELGVVHEIALSGPAPASRAPPDAEAMPGPASDRLWGQDHPAEAGFIVAAASDGRADFQVIDIDLRLVYRTGPSDADAVRAAAAVVDPETLVRAVAARLLSGFFASRTLAGVLGADRDAFSAALTAQLQHELEALGTGLEVITVVVEAIHPPRGAAAAYQSVQASEIRAQELVATQTGLAAKAGSDAASVAESAIAGAAAGAAEIMADARQRRTLFEADRAAHDRDPVSFLLEQRLDRLSGRLGRGEVLIVDHRLPPGAVPTLDLRRPGGFAPLP